MASVPSSDLTQVALLHATGIVQQIAAGTVVFEQTCVSLVPLPKQGVPSNFPVGHNVQLAHWMSDVALQVVAIYCPRRQLVEQAEHSPLSRKKPFAQVVQVTETPVEVKLHDVDIQPGKTGHTSTGGVTAHTEVSLVVLPEQGVTAISPGTQEQFLH